MLDLKPANEIRVRKKSRTKRKQRTRKSMAVSPFANKVRAPPWLPANNY